MRIFSGWRGAQRRRQLWIATLQENLERALAEGRLAFALRFCEELLAADPRNLQAWLVRGHLAWKHEQDQAKAVSCYRQVLILGGFESANAYVAQARACLAQLLERET